ncbi:Flp pilus assembly protein CpaB [Polycyclovorans algicola]|uniref:Flp pilus assembly protein CpaB n=1 Tax=Polycyclovorans algicola TaxID=616992 RepID=UPI0004A6C1F3|nr:Flp pilus assembly protein CpaB [Polycyclovorans algicola]
MNQNSLKIAAAVLAVLAVLLGIAVALSYRATTADAAAARAEAEAQRQERQETDAAQAPTTLAVVAIKPLAANQPIDRESVSLLPVAVTPAQYFTDLDKVIGRTPLVDIDAGAPVTARYFGRANQLARVIPDDHVAMSMEVNDIVAVGDFIRPGDNVDLLVYLRGGGGVEQTQARILLPKARVLAYEDRIIDRPEGIEEDSAQPDTRRRIRTAVLAVPEVDVTRVMLGMSVGELRLALRGQRPLADDTTETGLQMTDAATQAEADAKVPDQVISLEELGRIKPPPAQARNTPPPRPSVEIIRANDVTRVRP